MSDRRRKLVTLNDLVSAVSLLALVPVALLVPKSWWPRCCNGYAWLASLVKIPQLARIAASLETLQGDGDTENGYRRCLALTFEARLQIVDQNLLRRQLLETVIDGTRHIDESLASGNGVILWITPSAFSDLVVKAGLSQAGYAVNHLSRPEHGFSDSRFGVAVLNRLRTRIEDRYLDSRITISEEREAKAMLALRRALKNNGVVTIVVGANTRSPVEMTLGNGRMPISIGPVRLAEATGAPLLPVFGFQTGDGGFGVDIGEPLNPPGVESGEVLDRYSTLFMSYIDRYPWQARGVSRFSIDD